MKAFSAQKMQRWIEKKNFCTSCSCILATDFLRLVKAGIREDLPATVGT